MKKIEELSKEQQTQVNKSLELSMEHASVNTQTGMALAMNIANTEFYKTIKNYALYKYVFSSDIGDFTVDWCSYCELIIRKSEAEVERMFFELPLMEAEFISLFKDRLEIQNFLKSYRNKNALFFNRLMSTKQ